MADNNEKIIKILELIDKRLDEYGQAIADVKTSVEAVHHGVVDVMQGQERLEKGQQDIRGKMATKADVERVEKEVDKLKKRLPPHRAD